ncbi:MAG TPA: MFS transporter [Acidimicrobiales bacterium]|nr:MFS transporter [Acidimicrobiales bacterium]
MPITPGGTEPRDGRSPSWALPEVPVESAGVDEVAVVPWPLLLRLRRQLRGFTRRADSSSRWTVLVVALAGLFTVSVTITLLAVSLVDIANDVGSDEITLSWVITGPMLAFGVVGPAFGKAGDIWGHKKVFLLGLLGAAVFAVATAFAWSAVSLIVFRTLSASFGAATGPPAMAIINGLFDAEERVKALGYFSFVQAGAPVLGVVAGGPLIEAVGWRVIFLVQAPLCVIAFLAALVRMPETERRSRTSFDVAGTVLLGVGITAMLLAVNRGSDWGWTSPGVAGGLVVFFVCVPAFLAVERRASEPLIPPSWLRKRNITAPVASQFFANFAYMGGFIVTPVLLENGLGYSTAFVGLLIISRPLAFSVAAPAAGYITVRVRERVAGVAGSAILVVSMVLLGMIDVDATPAFIVLALAASGIGLGVSSPALTATIANAVGDDDLGVAAAVQQLSTQVGSVVGIQVMQTVQSSTESGAGVIGSFANAYHVGAVAAGAAVVAALWVRPTVQPAPAYGRSEALAGASTR